MIIKHIIKDLFSQFFILTVLMLGLSQYGCGNGLVILLRENGDATDAIITSASVSDDDYTSDHEIEIYQYPLFPFDQSVHTSWHPY